MEKQLLKEAQKVALLCKNKTEFQDNYRKYWKILIRHPQLYKKATSHMINPLNKWTKPNVAKIVAKCKNRYELQVKYKGAYWAAQQNGWLDELFAHKPSELKKWTLATATAKAKEFTTRKQFRLEARGAHNFLQRHSKQALDKACAHMDVKFRWTDEMAINLCKKYSTRKALLQDPNGSGCYAYVFKAKIQDKALSHMEKVLDQVEKREQAVFEKKLRDLLVANKLNFVLLKEFRMVPNKSYRVDLLLNIVPLNMKVAIEFKADASSWKLKEIAKQRAFYQKHLAKLGVKETYLVSTKGKWGWSEEEFLKTLEKMIKTKKVVPFKEKAK